MHVAHPSPAAMLGLHRVCVQNAEDGPAQWEAHRVCGQVHPCQGARLWLVADGAHSSGASWPEPAQAPH